MDAGYQLYKKLRLQGCSHEEASGYENMYVSKDWYEQFECERSSGTVRDFEDDRHPGVPSDYH